MKEEKDMLPDELFRQNLDDFEVPYNPAAWDHMRSLLDGEKPARPVGFVIIPKNHRKKIIITMASITIVTGLLLLAGTFRTHTSEKAIPAAKVSAVEVAPGTDRPIESPAAKTADINKPEQKTVSDRNSSGNDRRPAATGADASGRVVASGDDKGAESEKPAVMEILSETGTSDAKGSAGAADLGLKTMTASAASGSMAKTSQGLLSVTHAAPFGIRPSLVNAADPRMWARTRNSFVSPAFPKGKNYAFQDGFIGMHFTWQEPITARLQDSNRQNAGFNIQFMSRNLSSVNPFGAYLGLDWGMQFYGHGPKTNVQLNTNAGDSGWTRLSTFSMDFFARGHLEYARFRIVPYVNAFAGPRLYSTNQKVKSYLPLKDNESSDLSNAATSLSFMYGFGGGLRVRVSDVVSLDARMDWMSGTPVRMVDLDGSSFNGLNYNLNRFSVVPEYYQFRFGVLFNVGDDDASDDHAQARTYSQYNYNNRSEPVYEYYDSSTRTWKEVPVCPCTCDSAGKQIDVSKIRKTYRTSSGVYYQPRPGAPWPQPDPEPPSGRRGSGFSPSLPSGGGKGSFPGISPGGGGIKIKS